MKLHKIISLLIATMFIGTLCNAVSLSRVKIGLFGSPQARVMNNITSQTETALTAVESETEAWLGDGLMSISTLAISAGDAATFKTTTTTYFTISGIQYSKAAADAITFTAADTVNTAGGSIGVSYGAWLIQTVAAGTVSTKPAGGLSDQVYASAALAIAALPDVDALNVSLGYLVVTTPDATPFVGNTTALTGVDTWVDTAVKTLPSF